MERIDIKLCPKKLNSDNQLESTIKIAILLLYWQNNKYINTRNIITEIIIICLNKFVQ